MNESIQAIGRRRWAIAEGYIPRDDAVLSRELVSHEAICILNSGDAEAHVQLHAFFADREPAGPYRFVIAPRRTLHVRINDLTDPQPIPPETEYSMLIESDENIVVQHTRLDSRRSALALLSTIAFSSD